MKWFVYSLEGTVRIELDDSVLIEKLISDTEEIIKSSAYACNFEKVKEYTDFLLALKASFEELKEGDEEK